MLPTVALAITSAGSQLRFTRSAMLETIRQEYIKTARAKGAPEKNVVFGHALKNAALPIITVIGTNFGGLLGGAVITESIFSLPGLGTLLVEGISAERHSVHHGSDGLLRVPVLYLYAAG